jgi:hypothetical protein
MNKFQKLYQINKDIELLENAGKIKAANVLHNKFIKEAQYAMPQMMPMMMPQMMMPQMMPQMMPMMMARPVAPAAAARPAVAPTTAPAPAQVTTNQAGQSGQTGQGIPGKPTVTPTPGGQVNPPYEGSNTNPGGQNVPPPTPPPTQYGDKNKKDQELQYLENELQRLQREYGMDCGPFAAQCNTLRGMIDKNKGGSVAKS